MAKDKIFLGKQVLIDGELRPAAVIVRDGKIHAVLEGDLGNIDGDVDVVDAGEDVLMPGLVDSHVHINEPGRTDWEGFRWWSTTGISSHSPHLHLGPLPRLLQLEE